MSSLPNISLPRLPSVFTEPFNMYRGRGSDEADPNAKKTTVFALSVIGAFLSHCFLPKDIRGTVSLLSVGAGVLYSFCGCSIDRIIDFVTAFLPDGRSSRTSYRSGHRDSGFGSPYNTPRRLDFSHSHRGSTHRHDSTQYPTFHERKRDDSPELEMKVPITTYPAAHVVSDSHSTDLHMGSMHSGTRRKKKKWERQDHSQPISSWGYTPPDSHRRIHSSPFGVTHMSDHTLTDVHRDRQSHTHSAAHVESEDGLTDLHMGSMHSGTRRKKKHGQGDTW